MREAPGLKKKPSTSEVLDWLKLLLAEDLDAEDLRATGPALPKLHGALLKNEQDVHCSSGWPSWRDRPAALRPDWRGYRFHEIHPEMTVPTRFRARLLGLAAFLTTLAACTPAGPGPGVATSALAERRIAALPGEAVMMNRFPAPRPAAPDRSNAEIAADFLDLTFAMESGRPIARMTRFEGPIGIAVNGRPPATLTADLDALIGRLRREAGIDVARVPSSDASARIRIETLPRARMQRVVPHAACFVVPRVGSWAEFRRVRGGRELDWTTLQTRERVTVFIPSDVAPQEVRDCLHEEIAQALGPLNDLYRLPDSVFNDDNFHAVLTGFDMLILRTYYDAELANGMTRAEVAARLPAILDRLNPAGARQPAQPVRTTTRPWIEAIETALGPGTSEAVRIFLEGGRTC
jgi:hypothetical protein